MKTTINLLDSKTQLVCNQRLRHISNKRTVWLAQWDEKEVVAKVFSHRHKAKQHFLRELQGHQLLKESGVPTPSLYYQGQSSDKKSYILLFEYIKNSRNFLDYWECNKFAPDIEIMINVLTIEIATQHVLGIIQKDLHFKNFLIASQKIYTIDGGDIEKKEYPVMKKLSLENLALLTAQFGVHAFTHAEKIFRFYAQLRGWQIRESDYQFFKKMIHQWQRIRLTQYKKKILRSSSDFERKNHFTSISIYRRKVNVPTFQVFLQNPEEVFQNNQSVFLKKGRSSTVIQTQLGEQSFVIKRYNIKSFFHAIKRAWRSTRAMHCWRFSHGLELMGIPTPKPIAFVEKRILGLRLRSYFITEYQEGKNAGDFFLSPHTSAEDKEKIAKEIIQLFSDLATFRLIHGDLKTTNLLVHQGKVSLIDLDGMKICSSFRFNSLFKKELKRFLKNWENHPSVYKLFLDLIKDRFHDKKFAI